MPPRLAFALLALALPACAPPEAPAGDDLRSGVIVGAVLLHPPLHQPCPGRCIAGIAPLDCMLDGPGAILYNGQGDVEVVYAFSDVSGQSGSYETKVLDLATTIAQESAHAYGLGHSNNMADVM